MANVPDISVTAVGTVRRKWKVDTMCLAIFNFRLAGIHCPLVISPRSDNLNVRSQCFNAKLKTNLVIALASSAVANSSGTFFSCNFHKFLCDKGSCHRGSQKIFIFIDGICLHAGNDVLVTEFVNYILNVELLCATRFCALLKSVKLLLLSTVNAYTDNLIVKILL